MSKFVDKLCTVQDHKNFQLLSPLRLDDEIYGVIVVPTGFTSDYATLFVFHNAFLFVVYALLVGYGNRAAVVHDHLYTEKSLTRRQADDVFYRALRADGVAKWRAFIFWAGVRVFGRKYYGN